MAAIEFYVWPASPPADKRRKYRPITGPWPDLERAKESAAAWERAGGRPMIVLDHLGDVWST